MADREREDRAEAERLRREEEKRRIERSQFAKPNTNAKQRP
jgi:hypothetical protein